MIALKLRKLYDMMPVMANYKQFNLVNKLPSVTHKFYLRNLYLGIDDEEFNNMQCVVCNLESISTTLDETI